MASCRPLVYFSLLAALIVFILVIAFFQDYPITQQGSSPQSYLSYRIMNHGLRLPSNNNYVRYTAITSDPILNLRPVPALHLTIPLKYPKETRLKFINNHNSIHRGSHTIEIPLALLSYLNEVQYALGIKGTIGEIGVHGGLFFIAIAHLAFVGESLWVCDVFDQQEKNIDKSGKGEYDYFIRKTEEFGIVKSDMSISISSSADLPLDITHTLDIPKFRIISLDGGHTRQLTFNDLTIAAQNLLPGGIIVLDDITNLFWLGVIDGFFSWINLYNDEFAPFFLGHNKVSRSEYNFGFNADIF